MHAENARPRKKHDPGVPVRPNRVVIAIDFHPSSLEAARWVMHHVAPEAAHELIHVAEPPDLPGPLRRLGGDRERLRRESLEEARYRLQELAESAPGSRVRTHIREGKPAAEIVRFAEEVGADLIVVGEQGPLRGVRTLLGSTAERVLHDARAPVLVTRKVPDAPPRRLLAAIDDSDIAGGVLAWTNTLLERTDATATVLNVVNRLHLVDELIGLPSAADLLRLEKEASVAMQEWLDDMVREAALPESRIERTVVVGDPGYEIISRAAAADIDLVLVGSKGGDVARTTLIGRIINRTVRSAPCSVLVVTG